MKFPGRFVKKSVFLLFLAVLSPLQADTWTLACQKFTFSQKGADTSVNARIATVLPELILEQIAQNGIRSVSFQEQLDRELYALQTERLSLFLQLSKETKTRDALVLSKDKPRELKKSIKEEQEKIEEIEKKIDENLDSVKETQEKYQKQIALENEENPQQKRENPLFFLERPFRLFEKDEERLEKKTETVEIYKNDNTKLFAPSQKALNEGTDSYAFNKEVTDAKINGLLTGEITIFGEYISVTVKLSLFPGNNCTATVTEVGNSSDLISIAQNIMRGLTPAVANSIPVKIKVEIEPPQARSTAVVSVDGVIVPLTDDIVVDAGIHSVSISAGGYEKQTVNYAFAGEELFIVKTTLQPLVMGSLEICLKKMGRGVFYFNAMDSASVDEENRYASASVNGKPILSIYKDEDGNSAFVYISEKLAKDENLLAVNAKPYDREKNIDKRRRRMYTAYSALICSLVPTFYTIGNFTSLNNSYASGGASYDEVLKWQKYSYYTIGVSCTAGVWFGVELVRYLFAANEVLPATAKVQKK